VPQNIEDEINGISRTPPLKINTNILNTQYELTHTHETLKLNTPKPFETLNETQESRQGFHP
jgi:hypothetical protein